MKNLKYYKKALIISSIILTGCSANNAAVKTITSPVDGKTRTTITGSNFSMSYIYPIEGSNNSTGMEIAGGSVIDKEYASDKGYRKAYFQADGERFEMNPTNAVTDFNANKHGVKATKEFIMTCDDIKQVAQSKEVYLRITFADGFTDYNVSKSNNGTDGFEMIKKIAMYCD